MGLPPLPPPPGPAIGEDKPQAVAPVLMPPPAQGKPDLIGEFNGIAAKFPQQMPQEVYDYYRGQFFQNRAVPLIEPGESIQAGWDAFKKGTDRPHLLDTSQRGMLHLAIAAHATIDSMLAPIKQMMPDQTMFENAASDMQKMQTLAEREGMDTKWDMMGGGLLGMGADLGLLTTAAGPGAAALVQMGGAAGRTAEIATSILKGGMAFGTYDALSAQNNRLVAGLKGFGLGALTEGVLGSVFKGGDVNAETGKSVVENVEKASALGEKPPPVVDEAVANKVVQSAQTATKEGRALNWVQNTGQRGARVTVTDVGGNTQQLEIKSGREYDTLRQVQQLVQQGGSVDKMEVNPEDLPLMTRYLQIEEGMVNAKAKRVNLDVPTPEPPPGPKTEVIPTEPPATVKPPGEPVQPSAPERMNKAIADAFSSMKPIRTEDEVFAKLDEEGVPDSALDEMMLQKLLRVNDQDLDRWVQAIKTRNEVMQETQRIAEQRPTTPVRNLPDPLSIATPPGEFREAGQPIPEDVDTQVKMTPSGPRLRISSELMQKLAPGSDAFTASRGAQDLPEELANRIPEGFKDQPIQVFTEPNRAIQYHEGMHTDMLNTGMWNELSGLISPKYRPTATQLMGRISESPVYFTSEGNDLLHEAFTHAATAVRTNDVDLLRTLGEADGGVDNVKAFVGDTAQNILEQSQLKRPSLPLFIIQRKMGDLIRRTSDNIADSLQEGADPVLGDGWYDKQRGWVLRQPNGQEIEFKDINGYWDYVSSSHDPLAAPDYLHMASLSGTSGGMAPPNQAPIGRQPPNPESGRIQGGQFGWNAVSALWRPMLPWAAALDEKLNAVARVTGKKFPVFDLVSAVDKAGSEADLWTEKAYSTLAPIMEEFKDSKMKDAYEYLTHTEAERTPELQAKLKITPAQALAAEKYANWMKEFDGETHIDVQHYLTGQYPRLRGMGWDPNQVWGPDLGPNSYQSFWNKAIRNGDWNPQDNHLGRLTSFLIRSGREAQFTGEPLADLNKMLQQRTPEGDYVLPQAVRYPLQNYHNYMKNMPDMSQQMLTNFMQNAMTGLNDRIEQVNQHLPSGVQIPKFESTPKELIDKMMLLSYAMGLGARPAIVLRDTAAVFTTGMPIMGPGRFMRAMASGLTSNGMKFADESGALLSKHNVGEMYGDIFNDMPPPGRDWEGRLMKWSNQLLGPSRWGTNLGRSIVFNGEYNDAARLITGVRSNSASIDDLMQGTMLHWHDGPVQRQLLEAVADKGQPVEDVAKQFGRRAVDLTQWPYRRGTQPMLLRYGAGRILGQYGVWPSNFVDLAARVGRKWFSDPTTAARTMATWGAVNYAFSSAGAAAGIDLDKWFWMSPAGYAGSPHLQFIQNLMKSPENTEEGRQARRDVLSYPMSFIPARVEMGNVLDAITNNATWPPTHDNFASVMGFKPLEHVTRGQDWEDWVKYQLGQPKGGNNGTK